jgi:tagaturonate epimerase
MSVSPKFIIFPNSIHTANAEAVSARGFTCFMARQADSGARVLGVRQPPGSPAAPFQAPVHSDGDDQFFALTAENASALRELFPWLNPVPLEPVEPAAQRRPSFGFGDRLGVATAGHIQALRAISNPLSIAPIFAQQSVRENARTGRNPQQVLDEAMWGVFQEGWRLPWGADADHLKQPGDIPPFIEAGYSFFTIDPGEYVDPAADADPPEALEAKINAQPWNEIGAQPWPSSSLADEFQSFCATHNLECERDQLTLAAMRAQAKYGRAVLHIIRMYRAVQNLKPGLFDFEASVDETESPTTVLEHYYIASQLKRFAVRFTSLAPRLPGQFNKGVDYVGDLIALEAEIKKHVAVMRQVGGYKLSLHSGSDKFSLYPILAHHAGPHLHVKTAGTSYLEALRVAALLDPTFFRQLLELARQRYSIDRQSYHVSAEEERLPVADTIVESMLPGQLDDFHVRQALHVTFGSALARYGRPLADLIQRHPEAYERGLVSHFKRHLEPLLPVIQPDGD